VADITPQEQEEFEFRQRMEQEQGAAQQPEQADKSLADKATDYVGPEFLINTGLTAAGAIAGPGIKKEIELTGLPGMRSSAETVMKQGLDRYLASQLKIPEGTVTVEQLSKAVNMPIRTPSEVQDALELIKSKPGERAPVTKIVNGVPTVVRHKEILARPPIDLSQFAQETQAAAKGPGVIEGLKTAPMQTLGRGVGALGELTNRIISPGFSQFGNRLVGGLGGLDFGLQGTQAVKHFGEGQIGRGLVSTLGALGGVGAMTRHPIVMPLGIGASIAAPYINEQLEKIAKKHPQLYLAEGGAVHMADGGMPNINLSANTMPSMNGMPGVGYMQIPQGAILRMQLEQELANKARLRAGATGMGMAIPGQQGVKMMPGSVEAGLNIPVGQGNVDISGHRSINPVNMPAQRGGHMHGANVRYTLPFAKGGDVKKPKANEGAA